MGATTAITAALRNSLWRVTVSETVDIHYSPITLAVDISEVKGNSYQRVK